MTADATVPRVCLVGPLPPPAGGMANQCEQLHRLLAADGVPVRIVRSNAGYRPRWVGRVPVVRAAFRLLPYLLTLWREMGRAQVGHVFANSGWAWHLFAAPAVWIARARGAAVIVNYRGGGAAEFLRSAPGHVMRTLRSATVCVTPSSYLQRVFAGFGLTATIVPNIIDLSRFAGAAAPTAATGGPRIVVARNLEAIYGIATALRAFARVCVRFPSASLVVAGEGPELEHLRQLATELGVAQAVDFVGRVDNSQMPQLYRQAACALNPSTVDNMPISILEAFASGVPVVSTDAGGIPDFVRDGHTALLVPVGNVEAMAEAICRVLADEALARDLRVRALEDVKAYSWPVVREQWLSIYRAANAAQRGR